MKERYTDQFNMHKDQCEENKHDMEARKSNNKSLTQEKKI